MTEFNINEFMSTHKSYVNSQELIKALPIEVGEFSSITELARNFYSQHTHGGLIWYLYYCMGVSHVDSLTVIIRPEMIWFTILNELVIYINGNKQLFGHILNIKQFGKPVFTRVNDGSAIDINELTERLKTFFVNKDFFKLICDTRFSSEVPLSNYSIRMLFAFMGSKATSINSSGKIQNQKVLPNRNLNIKIVGSRKDWITLYKSVEKLGIYSPKINKKERGGFESVNDVNIYSNYINRCKSVIANIMSSQSKNEFKYDIFRYTNNSNNVYHNKPFIVEGWAKLFYINCNKLSMAEFNTHLNYIPYEKLDNNQTFCQISGLLYSNIHEDKTTIFDSQYGIIKLHIKDGNIYRKIVNSNKLHNSNDNAMLNNMQPVQTHLKHFDEADKQFVKHKNSFKDTHIMSMNPISSFPQARGTSTFQCEAVNNNNLADIHPNMRHSHQLNTIPPPQSVLFELKAPNENMGKTYGGDYTSAFERDQTIPMMGGSMPQN
jgi:Domain of unknown function (DUF4419)